MYSTESLLPNSSNNWKVDTDLFETIFGSDSDLRKIENTFDENDSSSTLTNNTPTSYITLQTPEQGSQATYLTNEHTVDVFQHNIAEQHEAPTSISLSNNKNVEFILDHTQSSQPTENSVRYEAVSQPFHIPPTEMLSAGENVHQ